MFGTISAAPKIYRGDEILPHLEINLEKKWPPSESHWEIIEKLELLH